MRAYPLVQAVLARFPGAEVVDVRKGAVALPQELSPGDSEDAAPELAPEDDGSAFGAQVPHGGRSDEADDDL